MRAFAGRRGGMAMTPWEARLLNEQGVATGGCWRCIQDANNYETRQISDSRRKTQWKTSELKFIGHRQFCPEHYRQETQGSRDF